MRVKRLEIQGFKSFKDKTVIHFDHGITGIVGPNGCGKSNIVDAFFWVMGEQSYKHMRGSSSDDLIFNGSSKYSPVGLAEATLVMETGVIDPETAPAGATTQDVPIHLKSKEISVTRRLYRSGEGEYFINGTSARLKDIHELFMDTGVGAKGYSVIEQGQIGKIVNSKPEERRLLVEEAAGIAKYKARKKESLRKMESTQGNLSRLTDIIQEIEKNLNSLDRQAQKARLYRKYKDELQSKEVNWGRRKYKAFQQKLDAFRKQKEALEHELVGHRSELQSSENSIEADRIELVIQTKKAEDLQTEIQELAAQLSQEKSALELSRRRQGDLTNQLESLEMEKQELEEALEHDAQRISEIEGETAQADSVLQNASIEASELNAALDTVRKEVDIARQKLDASQRELRNGMSQVSEWTSRSASLTSKAESAQFQAERLSQQKETQEEKLNSLQDELSQHREKTEALKIQRQGLQTEKKDQSTELQIQEQEIRQAEKNKEASLRTVTQLKSKLQSLEELDQSHEGLADGPKAALEWAKSAGKRDQIKALTDLLTVSDGLESVLQSWLEARLESLVVEDPQIAFSIFEQIKAKKQGRVAIQLHSQLSGASAEHIPAYSEAKTVLEKAGFSVVTCLSDAVTSKTHSQILDKLLTHVCVVESSDSLPQWIAQNKMTTLPGWSIVSKDGVVLESQGTLRGGSLATSGAVGILQRKKLIEELRVQVTEVEAKHQEVENDLLQKKQTVETAKARLQTLQTDLQNLEVEIVALDRDIHQTDRSLKDAQFQLESIEEEYEEQTHFAQQAQEERENIEIQLRELVSTQTDLEEGITAAQNHLAEKDTIKQAKESELQTLRIKEASLKERAQSLKRELDATRSLMGDRKRRITEVHRTLERATREQEEFSGGESELGQKIEELTTEIAGRRETLSLLKNQIEQYNAKVNQVMERIKELHKVGDEKTTQINQFALEVEKLNSEILFLIQNLEEKYGPGCLAATPAAIPTLEIPSQSETPQDAQADTATEAGPETTSDPIDSPEQEIALGEEVERLRERIRRLGEVNVMAIDEYEELKKRYDHLTQEKTDLEQSLKNLESAIEHINQTSEERFKKAFDTIAERFERLFPIVFGGGQAKLSLIYPEGSNDILEAGVDILAQPPGKKVANITLLSGGEKALTAVSLIFAIFMVKPSPFCLLDEVDAPLDDANIGKFNALLREMSAKSQFIIITHNKKTMELNDTLYGVTMEEPGVSKMVSIEMQ